MFFISYFAAFLSALLLLFFCCLVFVVLFSPDDFDVVITKNEDLDARLNLELSNQQHYIGSTTGSKAKYWCLGVVFFTVFGALGSTDFDYKCKRAHEMNPKESCKMIAAKKATVRGV